MQTAQQAELPLLRFFNYTRIYQLLIQQKKDWLIKEHDALKLKLSFMMNTH